MCVYGVIDGNNVINMKIDTGAMKNVISHSDYMKIKSRQNLYPTNVKLVSYTKHSKTSLERHL